MSEVAARETLGERALAMKAVVALLHVADVQRSIEFYQKLEFELGNDPLTNEQGTKIFAWLHRGQRAQIMVTAGRRLCPDAQDVMFYLYVDDLIAYREAVISRGITAGDMQYPFWNRDGEFRIDDPDGWIWQVC